jgi:uncharacterized protein (DUF4415 family)
VTGKDIRRATLDEIFEMDRRGELYHNSDAPEGPALGDEFWENAVWSPAPPHDTIVLPVERAMMEWFKREYPDYPERMNEILRAHMTAAELKKAS